VVSPFYFRLRAAAAQVDARPVRRLETGSGADDVIGQRGGHDRARENVGAPVREPRGGGICAHRPPLASLTQ